ncbi:MAG TPA: M36 family metallopeptidase [Gaiellaceae bacterium]|nr:M36 family metallopeptidase [Gaiellaceae bacterium]
MRRTLILAAAAALSTVVVAGALAAKPPNGSSTGVGTVFLPNPVAELQDQSLTDQKDADYAALAPAYHDVTLTNLDGSGRLCGDWACIRAETGVSAYSPTNTFRYRRDDDRFEQVMAYYWVTQAQLYLQSLGFGSELRAINAEPQDIRINQWGQDNSYSWDKHDILRFGKGGVDDAEDAEVILHEYGHAVQDSQQTPFGFGLTAESGALGEGFADYLAGTVSAHVAPTPDPACIADWDSVSYDPTAPHCLRRLDANLHYPADVDLTRIHRTGQIWSQALWEIRTALGPVVADRIILEAGFHYGTSPTMPSAAAATIEVAHDLYGPATAAVVQQKFADRGLA